MQINIKQYSILSDRLLVLDDLDNDLKLKKIISNNHLQRWCNGY